MIYCLVLPCHGITQDEVKFISSHAATLVVRTGMKTAFSVSVLRLGSGLLVELVCIASLCGGFVWLFPRWPFRGIFYVFGLIRFLLCSCCSVSLVMESTYSYPFRPFTTSSRIIAYDYVMDKYPQCRPRDFRSVEYTGLVIWPLDGRW